MSDLVRNPQDRFSHNKAHMYPSHNVKIIHGICYLLTASGNLFLNISDAWESAIGIAHISEKISIFCIRKLK